MTRQASGVRGTGRYASYGRRIHEWRNEIKHPYALVAQGVGMSVERLKTLEAGDEKPTWEELERLA